MWSLIWIHWFFHPFSEYLLSIIHCFEMYSRLVFDNSLFTIFLLSFWWFLEVDYRMSQIDATMFLSFFFPIFHFSHFILFSGILSSNPFSGVWNVVIKCLVYERPFSFFITYFHRTIFFFTGCSTFSLSVRIFIMIFEVHFLSP